MFFVMRHRWWSYKMSLKVEVFHKERIIPSSPTPHHLRNFRLSIFDQFSPAVHVPLILFYPNNSDIHEATNDDPKCLIVERTKLLKRSLSDALTHFYPFAGRIQDEASVCCNDKGAMFLEAQVNCPISMALEKPDLGFVKDLIPNLQSAEGDSGHDLLLVQANFFECGGVAIGVNISHKIIDAFTLGTFLNSWSAASRGLHLPPHKYDGAASCFPPLELFKPQLQFENVPNKRCTTRRFLFESSKIECLKSIAASTDVQNPMRVEVVSALIWKCAMQASSANSSSARPSSSAWVVTVNMRKILAQPSAEHLLGNLLGFFTAVSKKGESEDDLRGLVAAMRKAFLELKVKYGTNGIGVDDVCRHLKQYNELLQKDDIECYCSISWCRLPFHETNFGWGKPLMSSPARVTFKNLSFMKDTSGRGIEVRLTLKEEDMVIFDNNEELLAFASLNPSVI